MGSELPQEEVRPELAEEPLDDGEWDVPAGIDKAVGEAFAALAEIAKNDDHEVEFRVQAGAEIIGWCASFAEAGEAPYFPGAMPEAMRSYFFLKNHEDAEEELDGSDTEDKADDEEDKDEDEERKHEREPEVVGD